VQVQGDFGKSLIIKWHDSLGFKGMMPGASFGEFWQKGMITSAIILKWNESLNGMITSASLRGFGRSLLFEWHEFQTDDVRCKSPAIFAEVSYLNGMSFEGMVLGASLEGFWQKSAI
jgi:hypothetical protein